MVMSVLVVKGHCLVRAGRNTRSAHSKRLIRVGVLRMKAEGVQGRALTARERISCRRALHEVVPVNSKRKIVATAVAVLERKVL